MFHDAEKLLHACQFMLPCRRKLLIWQWISQPVSVAITNPAERATGIQPNVPQDSLRRSMTAADQRAGLICQQK
jgi:hypothetical protein